MYNNNVPKPSSTYGHPKPRKKPGKQWIEVGNGNFALIDEKDWDRVNEYKWVWKKGKQVHSLHSIGEPCHNLKYFIKGKKGKRGYVIYHLDGNKLNFCRDNLRLITLKKARALDKKFDRRKPIKQRIETKRVTPEFIGFKGPHVPLTKASVDSWIKLYYAKYQKVPRKGNEFTNGWDWRTIGEWIRKNHKISTGIYMKEKLGLKTRSYQPFTIPLIKSWIKDFFVQTGRLPIVNRDKKSCQSTDGRTWISIDCWLMRNGTSLYELTGRKKRDGRNLFKTSRL